MEKKIDVLIKGQGIIGLTLALHLAQKRIQVGLTKGISSRGTQTQQDIRYFALNPTSRHLLEDIDCWPAQEAVTAMKAMQIFGDLSGILDFVAPQAHQPLAWIVKASALQDQLAEKARLHPQIAFVEDAQESHAELVLVCEGKHSAMTQELGISYETQHYHQHAFATLLDTGVPHSERALQWFLDSPSGPEILGLLPCDGAQSSIMSMVWSLPSQRAFELKGMTNEQVEKEVDKAVGEHFPHVRILGPSAVWPLVASKANQWVGQRSAQQSWALLGDSAHTVHPLAGMGLNLGLADVAQMLEILEIRAEKEYWRKLNDLSLLRRYERSRKADILAPWLFCDAMQQLFSHPNTMVRSLRNLGLTGVQRLNFIKTFFLQQAGSTT